MSNWTDERVEFVKKRHREGDSASMIAAALGGTTRNAVIGKLHRLGLAGRGQPVRRLSNLSSHVYAKRIKCRKAAASAVERARWEAKAAASIAEYQAIQSGPDLAVPEAERKCLVDLGPKDCRWPYGDGPFTFCARQAVPGQAYCAFHVKRAQSPMEPRQRRRMPTTVPLMMLRTRPVTDPVYVMGEFEKLDLVNK